MLDNQHDFLVSLIDASWHNLRAEALNSSSQAHTVSYISSYISNTPHRRVQGVKQTSRPRDVVLQRSDSIMVLTLTLSIEVLSILPFLMAIL